MRGLICLKGVKFLPMMPRKNAPMPRTNFADPGVGNFCEGRVLTREHRFRERDRSLVNKKKQEALKVSGRLECEVCAFYFLAVYGEIGRNFAECHHALPISDLAEARETRLSDLAIVCANTATRCCTAPGLGKRFKN
jgi:5-methylcytosine-specific restriction enzyme A